MFHSKCTKSQSCAAILVSIHTDGSTIHTDCGFCNGYSCKKNCLLFFRHSSINEFNYRLLLSFIVYYFSYTKRPDANNILAFRAKSLSTSRTLQISVGYLLSILSFAYYTLHCSFVISIIL